MDLFSFQEDPSFQLYGPTNNPSIIWTDPLLALYERLPFRMSSSIAMTRLVCSIRALFYHFRLFKRPPAYEPILIRSLRPLHYPIVRAPIFLLQWFHRPI